MCRSMHTNRPQEKCPLPAGHPFPTPWKNSVLLPMCRPCYYYMSITPNPTNLLGQDCLLYTTADKKLAATPCPSQQPQHPIYTCHSHHYLHQPSFPVWIAHPLSRPEQTYWYFFWTVLAPINEARCKFSILYTTTEGNATTIKN